MEASSSSHPCTPPDRDSVPWGDYRAKLVVFARAFGGAAAADPEDTAQDIILRATARFGSFDGRHAFSTWLYRLARNYCIDANRCRRRRVEIFNRHGRHIAGLHRVRRGPEEQLERDEVRTAVAGAISRLAPDDRQIAFLRYFEELPVAQVSEVMGVPAGTVKYRLHVIIRTLASELEEVKR